MPGSIHETNRSDTSFSSLPSDAASAPKPTLERRNSSSSRSSSASDISAATGSPASARSPRTASTPLHYSPYARQPFELTTPPTRSLTDWIWSNKTLGLVCGLAAGGVAAALAPAMIPTATLLYNQAIFGASSFVVVGGAVTYDARLPLYALAAAMGATVGVACVLNVAAGMAPTGLAVAAGIGALVGLQVLRHRQAIALTLLAGLVFGITWWAASIVGPSQFGVAVPTPKFAA